VKEDAASVSMALQVQEFTQLHRPFARSVVTGPSTRSKKWEEG
jgi:hypothetical protein